MAGQFLLANIYFDDKQLEPAELSLAPFLTTHHLVESLVIDNASSR